MRRLSIFSATALILVSGPVFAADAPADGEPLRCTACEDALRKEVQGTNQRLDEAIVQLKDVNARLAKLADAQKVPPKSAIVLNFTSANRALGPQVATGSATRTPDAVSTSYCKTLNYNSGKALSATSAQGGFNWQHVEQLVCFD